jgi:type VI protein secretion system component VasK
MGLGLYRGGSLGAVARDAYTREINEILPPLLLEGFEHELRTSARSDKSRGLATAYLMLADARHRDPEYLKTWADLEWHRVYRADESQAQRIGEHFKQLFVDGDRLASQRVDPKILEQTR